MGLLDAQPKKIGGLLSELPDDATLNSMPWNEVYGLRLKYKGNPELQAKIAPFEHQAYAREQVSENPFTAPIWMAMPAGYQIYKALGGGGQDDMTTKPSLDQALAGMRGVRQGFGTSIRNLFK